jgi:hypothetical protein
LYLARKKVNGSLQYIIRETYRDGDLLRSRDLFDLGADPARFIIYPGGNSFYIDEAVEDSLAGAASRSSPDELEDIFWPFIKPRIKRALESFRRRELCYRQARRRPGAKADGPPHIFDKRRLYYLKTGHANQAGIGRLPPRFFRLLDNKSRDEIEQNLIQMEAILRSTELKTYVFTIFDIHKFFRESFAKDKPQFLDQSQVDTYFIEEICRLNDDRGFWSGMKTNDGLHEYLIRYAIMFFDFDYMPRNLTQETIRRFMNSRRDERVLRRSHVSVDEASSIFAVAKTSLQKMNRAQLARLFRRRAMKLHPDQGGDHDTFVKLTEAYHSLLRTKK